MSHAATSSVSKTATSSMNTGPKESVGGGAINEKERSYGKDIPVSQPLAESSSMNEGGSKTNFDPSNQPAHLLHAIVGLDRYPNYLFRWNYDLNDVDHLESALEEQLEKVRSQKQKILDRNEMIATIREKVAARTKVEKAMEDGESDESLDHFDIFTMPQTWDEIRNHV